MSEDNVTREELQLSLKSIVENSRTTMECLQTLTKSVEGIEKYIIHNDYRHAANENEIRLIKRKTDKKTSAIEKDVSLLLSMMDERKPLWSAFKKGKIAIGVVATGALATAGGALYNYIVKPQPVINQHKEQPKAAVKPVTKDLIK